MEHAGDADYSLITRSSDGQMMFLANMLSKMKNGTPLGSRIAEVHNGSSLFTGDAGQGESNIRRWIIENDWLEAIVALPLNMFYNTGIATYIWVLSNRKAEHRRGRVQLIDATQWSRPLRKNLGSKNCELSDEDIRRICDAFLAFEETEQSKTFPNEALATGRLPWSARCGSPSIYRRTIASASEPPVATQRTSRSPTSSIRWRQCWAPDLTLTSTDSWKSLWRMPPPHGVKLTAKRKNLLQMALASRDEAAAPVIKKTHKPGAVEPDQSAD